ncbi:transcription repressor OFP12-like [Rosa rugosa]|uniref:transcription repressor OFP12-like n=1 Tax=Rosa rugosa TaxID=74645 RepID=UPI002B4045BD|nr:transcription repressor OFP12-like [Rosa rugosa]
MSKLPWKKNLHLWLPNFKCLPLITQTPPQPSDQDHPHPHPQLMIINNFNTLYHDSNSSDQSTSKSLTASDDFFYSSSSDSEAAPDSPPDFATVFASQRFFFSSPGRSNSIVESPDPKPNNNDSFVTRGLTVSKYSSNPYLDFRNSMEEMLEARDRDHIDNKDRDHNVVDVLKSDLDYLHELLLCYLQLNPEDAHKDIISAFTDLVICILSANPAASTSTSADDDHRLEEEEEIPRQRPS